MASLPTVWTIVGCLLIVITLIAIVLFFVKAREVASLKKEVAELRDTMRMMRYEELSLSRMLHTADKAVAPAEVAELVAAEAMACVDDSLEESAGIPAVDEDITEQPTEEPAEDIAEEVVEEVAEESIEEVVESVEDVAESVEEETAGELTEESSELAVEEEIEEPSGEEAEEVIEEFEEPVEETVEEPAEEKSEAVESPEETVEDITEIEETVVEAPADEVVEDDIAASVEEETAPEFTEEVQSEEPVVVATGKQPINERRPAIPTDLFSAWFEEYEQTEPEVSVSVTAEETLSTPTVAVVEEPLSIVEPAEESEKTMENAETLAEESEEQVSVPTAMSKEDERFCRKFERIVDTRMRNPNLNIDVIAAQFGIGRTNFYRKVRELMGMSPNDYLRKCRMDRAAELLRTTDLPVSDVCVQIGVPDAQYFSRVFKTFYGVTPTAYREQA